MFDALDLRSLAYILVGLSVVFAAEALFLWLRAARGYRRQVNRRLALIEQSDRGQALVELRKRRGLTAEGRYALPVIWFNRLVTQSGVSLGVKVIPIIMLAATVIGSVLGYLFSGDIFLAALFGFSVGVGIPILLLYNLRKRRMARFEVQLPDAVDVMVRSLRAGHPIPVSLQMVAQELPDPLGSEFGIAFDELTYGRDMEAALANMRARVGQEDLSFLVLAVSVQAKTGGNLAEILANLSKVLRERFRMRRKVRALTAEGRFSALALTLLPFILVAVLFLIAPRFYLEIWDNPLVRPAILVSFSLLAVGNYIMYRMVHFRF